jgi:tetratricopeptide (TPR) repeat protein
MKFAQLAAKKKTLLGLIAYASGACVIDQGLKRLIPGAEGLEASAVTGGLLVRALPAAGDFLKGVYGKFGDLWFSHWQVQAKEEHDADAREQQTRFNHDLELQVGRTLAALVRRWAGDQDTAIAKIVSPLPEALETVDGTVPRWVRAAESVDVRTDDGFLIDIALGRPGGSLAPAVSASGWSALLRELARASEVAPTDVGYDTLWRRLGEFLQQEFPGQFYVDIKRALQDHPEAWAAMEYRIDAVVLEHVLETQRGVKATSHEVAQTHRDVLDIGARCASRLARSERQLKRLSETTSELGKLLQQAKEDLVALKVRPPLDLLPIDAVDGRTTRLHYTSRRVPHVGRKPLLETLKGFLAAAGGGTWKRFAWWLLTGPGGIGKSRLALELGLEVERDWAWDAGFFHKDSHATFPADQWKAWRPSRPTLVIFDYAAERPSEIGTAMRALHVLDQRGLLGYPVRFLLLERDHASARLVQGLTTERAQEEANAIANSAFGGEDTLHWHHEVPPLSDHELLDVVQHVLARKKREEDFPREGVLALLRRADARGQRLLPAGNPLFAAILAEALLEHGMDSVRGDTTEQLLRRLLANEKRHWQAAKADAGHINWLVLATLLRDAVPARNEWPGTLATLLPSLDEVREDVCELLSSYTPPLARGQGGMRPLEPDRLGELLVLDRLGGRSEVSFQGHGGSQASQQATRALLAVAWEIAPAGTSAFAARAIADYPFHGHIEELVRASFVTAQDRESLGYLDEVSRVLQRWGNLDAAELCAHLMLDHTRGRASSLGAPESRRDLSVSLDNVAKIELARGRHDAAFKLYSESLDLSRALASELGTPESRRDLSVSLNNVAQIELARGRHDAAFKLYSESLDLRRALASELGTPDAVFDHAVSCLYLGSLVGEPALACRLLGTARDLVRAVIAEVGSLPRYVQAAEAIEGALRERGC